MRTHLIDAPPELGPLPLGDVMAFAQPTPFASRAPARSTGKTPMPRPLTKTMPALAVLRAGSSEPAEFLPHSLYRVLRGRYAA